MTNMIKQLYFVVFVKWQTLKIIKNIVLELVLFSNYVIMIGLY